MFDKKIRLLSLVAIVMVMIMTILALVQSVQVTSMLDVLQSRDLLLNKKFIELEQVLHAGSIKVNRHSRCGVHHVLKPEIGFSFDASFKEAWSFKDPFESRLGEFRDLVEQARKHGEFEDGSKLSDKTQYVAMKFDIYISQAEKLHNYISDGSSKSIGSYEKDLDAVEDELNAAMSSIHEELTTRVASKVKEKRKLGGMIGWGVLVAGLFFCIWLGTCTVRLKRQVNGKFQFVLNYARDVENGIYKMHNVPSSEGELGAICKAYNLLLQQVQQRDEKIRQMVTVDPLTGVANSIKLEEHFAKEVIRENRYKHGLSLIIFDLDHFAAVNQRYGIAVGDKVLVEVADLVREVVRDCDFFARWGGAEFVILAPETTLKGAEILAQKLRQQIEEREFADLKVITASFGISQYKEKGTRNDLYWRADKALKQAKHSGRNNVVVLRD